jgi:hypothetical protein
MQKQNNFKGFYDTFIGRPLSSIDIIKKIQSDEYGRKYFLGVFPSDLIPTHVKYPCGFIVNTDTSSGPGKHWVAFYYNASGEATFFDSFGFPPVYYGFEDYLEKSSTKWQYNKVKVQHLLSSTCGYYTVFFILLMSRDLDLNEVISFFSSDKFLLNDFKIINI